jgi:NAD(P)-dependent dehydrogenase (short-subunit alcohol dehydrogenase family)
MTAAAASGRDRFRLDGRRALVTGASRGIGRACALAIAEAGADVALIARTRDELEAVADEVRARDAAATVVACDLRDDADLADAVTGVGPVDVLVNAAGLNVPAALADVRPEDLDAMLSLNVRALVRVTQAAVTGMARAGRGGAIVSVSSQMGHVGAPRRTVYCATKHAVEGFSKALAVEVAPAGIRVNTVAPTFVETPMTAPMLAEEAFRTWVLERLPLGRVGTAGEVAAAVVFLASPAASLVTGTSLLVDGGWTAQ